MQKLLELIVFIVIAGAAMANLMVVGHDVKAQNMTNASNLTGVENDSSSASVTARLYTPSPEPEPDDCPTPSPTDQ